jgi:hypothetical protein
MLLDPLFHVSQIIGAVGDHATASWWGGLQALRPSRLP